MNDLLTIQDLHVHLQLDSGVVSVLKGINLTIGSGQTVGVVGESGAGKSVLLRAILGLLKPPWHVVTGQVLWRGEDLLQKTEKELQQIRGKEIALTTANPRRHLNPVIPIGHQMVNVLMAHHRMKKSEAFTHAVQLLEAVGIPDAQRRFKAYAHELSGGMCQRVIIALGLANSPQLLMADEPTSGLDVTIQIQILDLMQDLVQNFHSALLLVSRDLAVVAHYCEKIAVMYDGQIVEMADVTTFFDHATHPYSRHLLRAAIAARDEDQAIDGRGGLRIEAAKTGCAYAPRCPVALDICRHQQEIPLAPLTKEHLVRCIRKQEIMERRINP